MKQKEERTIRKGKIAIAIMEYLVTLGCLITLFVMLTPKENITKTSSSYARPEEVSEYKIVNEYITRVRPLTEYGVFKEIAEETIKKNFENSCEIKVYTDTEKNEEVTKGYIASGMVVECSFKEADVEINQQEVDIEEDSNEVEKIDYTVSVIGDITKTGDCNITELTQIIRHIVGLEKMNSEINEFSADFNNDGIINVVDVSMCINYIVYGTMEADKTIPSAPEIKITGEGNKQESWYRSDIDIEIEDNQRKEGEINKTQTIVESKLEGSSKTNIETTTEKEFKLSKEGLFKISSQNYGSNGLRSEIVEKDVGIDKTAPTITSLSREEVDGSTYKINIVASDNIGIIKYRVINNNEEILVREIEKTQNMNESFQVNNNGKYTVLLEDIAGNIKEEEIEIDSLKGTYRIEFVNEDGSKISTQICKNGETVEVPNNPKKQGDEIYVYEFAGWEPEISSTATKDETYIAKYEQKYRKYTVRFLDETGEVLAERSDYHYNDNIEIPQQDFSKEDNKYIYEFIGWNKEIDEKVTKNVQYTAIYNKIPKEYTIKFLNEDGTEIVDEITFKSTDKTIKEEPVPPHKDGYVGQWEEYELKPENIEVRPYYEEAAPDGEMLYYTDKNGITWRFINQNGYATEVYYDSGEIGDTLEIPAVLNGYQVESLGSSFSLNMNDANRRIKHIFLPKVLTKIADNAFRDCEKLESIDIPNVTSIGDSAFNCCSSLESIELPNVTNIGDNAFYNCNCLQSVDIPNVTSIGDNVFYNCCSSLESIELPNVTNIGDNAFYNCNCLQSVDIPNVTSIGYSAFEYCGRLVNIEMPNVETIKANAFKDCDALTKITIPNIEYKDYWIFAYCDKLSDIYVDDIESNELSNDGWLWGCDAYIHYKDCKHNVINRISIDNVEIEQISNNLVDGKIDCGKHINLD